MLTKALFFGGGIAVGLLIADYYAKVKIQSTLDNGLGSLGLGGGKIQSFVDTYIAPAVS